MSRQHRNCKCGHRWSSHASDTGWCYAPKANCACKQYVDWKDAPTTTPGPGTAGVLAEVYAERQRQDSKWGQQDHHPFVMLAILGEEVGEANQAALQSIFGGKTWAEYRKELVQIAAVAVQMVEAFDRNGPPEPLEEAERRRYLMTRPVPQLAVAEYGPDARPVKGGERE